MRHPTRLDLYRLVLDAARKGEVDPLADLSSVVDTLLSRHGLAPDTIDHFVTTAISDADLDAFDDRLGAGRRLVKPDASTRGHLHSSDLVFGLRELMAREDATGSALLASHGHGFSCGATLITLS